MTTHSSALDMSYRHLNYLKPSIKCLIYTYHQPLNILSSPLHCTVLHCAYRHLQALKMALAARCNIIVALNKVDRIPKGPERTSARSRVLAQLIQLGLVPEEYGGNSFVCF